MIHQRTNSVKNQPQAGNRGRGGT